MHHPRLPLETFMFSRALFVVAVTALIGFIISTALVLSPAPEVSESQVTPRPYVPQDYTPPPPDLTLDEQELRCLQLNIYHEARSEGLIGQTSVGLVTLNRVQSPNFPDSVCEVVKQARRDAQGNLIRHKCQFSWYCDGMSDVAREPEAWEQSKLIAVALLYGMVDNWLPDVTYYHTTAVSPYWASHFTKVKIIGNHIFYKDV